MNNIIHRQYHQSRQLNIIQNNTNKQVKQTSTSAADTSLMAQLPVSKRSHASLSQQLNHSTEQASKSEVNRIASSSSTLSTAFSEGRPMLRRSLSTPSLQFIEDSNVSVKTSLIDDQYQQRAEEYDQKTNSSENAPMQAGGCVHYKRFCLFVVSFRERTYIIGV